MQGGVRVASPNGRFVVTNTLTSRLERARPALAAEVAKALWE
ncbi:MAG: V-type ATP synthase subunit E family protein [Armatimonadota bacterium]